jgi:Aspartyl protease
MALQPDGLKDGFEPAGRKYRFDHPDGRTAFPFELSRNGLFFRVRVEDSEPIWFTIDSGSGATYLDRTFAKRLGLHSHETKKVHGAGEGTVEVDVIENVAFELPGLSTWGHEIHTIDFQGLQEQWGRRLDGFFGFDFLERFVVIIDYKGRHLTILEPAQFQYEGPGTAFDLEFQGRLPFVRGTITVSGGLSEDSSFLVDSGSQDAVDHPLIAKASGTRPTLAGVGFGEATRGVFGRVEKFKLGPFEIEGLFGVAGQGLGSHLIGGQVLSRFKVVMNYQRKELILEPQHRSVRVAKPR